MKLRYFTLVISLLFSQFIHAEITVSVDRNPVVVDESFQLIFESNEKVKGEPDFTPLNKDFSILKTGRRSNTQIINGDFKQSHQWVLTAIANKTGTIRIPAIKFGKIASQPYQLKVVSNAAPTVGNKSDDIFINVEVNKESPYVQEQIVYTVKLYRAVQTGNATLSEPKISGDQAIVTKLGEDKSFETTVKGKRYVVVQRQYAIFPQSSGILKIEPVIFQGQVGSGSFFGFDPFGPQPKSVVKRSDSIVLDIKVIPDSFIGDTWLPASQLNIQEQWSVDPAQLKQGEATTRTLTITANGLASSHLPVIESNLPDYLKQYPDQPELNEKFDQEGFVGERREKMAIIPTQSGNFTLPAVKIPWWNTKTNKMEVAELPERQIKVLASEIMQTVEQPKPQVVQDKAVSLDNLQTEEKKTESVSESTYELPYWKWVSGVLLLLWLLTLFFLLKNKKSTTYKQQTSMDEISKRQSLKQIKHACINNDAAGVKNAILEWGRNMWPDEKINNLNSIKTHCDAAFKAQLDELNGYLYGQQKQSWNGKEFLKGFESQSFESKKANLEKGNLEPLYKS